MSDHVDSAVAKAASASDLTDLFAFSSPARPGYLVLVMDVFPRAPAGAISIDVLNVEVS